MNPYQTRYDFISLSLLLLTLFLSIHLISFSLVEAEEDTLFFLNTDTNNINNNDPNNEEKYLLIIDPGHGGNDHGVEIMESGIAEKDLTLQIAEKLQRLFLEKSPHKVILTRTVDQDLTIEDRAALANHHQGDFFLSLHFNTHLHPQLSELQIIVASYLEEEQKAFSSHKWNWKYNQYESISDSQEMALGIEKAALVSKNWESAKLLEMPAGVLQGVQMPAVLLELDFISNPKIIAKLKTKEYTQNIAETLFQGISSYLKTRAEND